MTPGNIGNYLGRFENEPEPSEQERICPHCGGDEFIDFIPDDWNTNASVRIPCAYCDGTGIHTEQVEDEPKKEVFGYKSGKFITINVRRGNRRIRSNEYNLDSYEVTKASIARLARVLAKLHHTVEFDSEMTPTIYFSSKQ
jgi:hypothetical protein